MTDDKWVIEDEYRFDKGNGLYYWYDQNHFGKIWVKQKIVEKYKLVIDPIDEDDLDEYEIEGDYTHEIFLYRCAGISKGNTYDDYCKSSQDTPYGKVWSEEFVCWWNDLPIELLKEEEKDVLVLGWADG